MALIIVGYVASIILAMWVQAKIDSTRGADLERAAMIAGRYQAARDAGDIAERERLQRYKKR